MMHDELLENIDNFIQYTNNLGGGRALRAVVELHKPFQIPEKFKDKDSILKQGLACYLCSTEMYIPYPCPTIHAIEKELA